MKSCTRFWGAFLAAAWAAGGLTSSVRADASHKDVAAAPPAVTIRVVRVLFARKHLGAPEAKPEGVASVEPEAESSSPVASAIQFRWVPLTLGDEGPSAPLASGGNTGTLPHFSLLDRTEPDRAVLASAESEVSVYKPRESNTLRGPSSDPPASARPLANVLPLITPADPVIDEMPSPPTRPASDFGSPAAIVMAPQRDAQRAWQYESPGHPNTQRSPVVVAEYALPRGAEAQHRPNAPTARTSFQQPLALRTVRAADQPTLAPSVAPAVVVQEPTATYSPPPMNAAPVAPAKPVDSNDTGFSSEPVIPLEIGPGEFSDPDFEYLPERSWWDGLQVITGFESYQGHSDSAASFQDITTNNFGGRIGANLGLPLLVDQNIGLQLAANFGVYDFKGRVIDPAVANRSPLPEYQTFVTVGLFRNCDLDRHRVSWGFAYDWMFAEQFSDSAVPVTLRQVRGQVGLALNPSDEVGVGGTINDGSDLVLGGPLLSRRFEALSYGYGFWRHVFESGADSKLWIGVPDSVALGQNQDISIDLLVGAVGRAPITDKWAFYGQVTYGNPSSHAGGIRNGPFNTLVGGPRDMYSQVFFGLEYRCGGRSNTVCDAGWLPYLSGGDHASVITDDSAPFAGR